MDLPRAIPLLVYDDIQAAHDFLVRAFGFEPGPVYTSPDGQAVHGEVKLGPTTIWLHRVSAEHQLDSPRRASVAHSGLVVQVANVDAHHARAALEGARIESVPNDMPYGQREYGARDPEGHRWWFASPINRSS